MAQTVSNLNAVDRHPQPGLAYRVATFLVSIAYGGILQALPVMAFKDRANYLNYAENAGNVLRAYAQDGLLTILANEPIWLTVNIILGALGNPGSRVRGCESFRLRLSAQ